MKKSGMEHVLDRIWGELEHYVVSKPPRDSLDAVWSLLTRVEPTKTPLFVNHFSGCFDNDCENWYSLYFDRSEAVECGRRDLSCEGVMRYRGTYQTEISSEIVSKVKENGGRIVNSTSDLAEILGVGYEYMKKIYSEKANEG